MGGAQEHFGPEILSYIFRISHVEKEKRGGKPNEDEDLAKVCNNPHISFCARTYQTIINKL